MNQHTACLWPPTFEGAIFDFDGTLSLTTSLWRTVDQTFFAEHGIEYTPDMHQTLATLGFTGGARWCIEAFGIKSTVEDICDEWNRMGSALYATEAVLRPGAERYVRQLRSAGIPCALATTNNRHVLSSMAPRVDVDDLFDTVVCSTDVQVSKREPDIYLEAARRIGVPIEKCVIFEDILTAVRTAAGTGATVCGVSCDDPLQDRDLIMDYASLWLEDWEDIPLP